MPARILPPTFSLGLRQNISLYSPRPRTFTASLFDFDFSEASFGLDARAHFDTTTHAGFEFSRQRADFFSDAAANVSAIDACGSMARH